MSATPGVSAPWECWLLSTPGHWAAVLLAGRWSEEKAQLGWHIWDVSQALPGRAEVGGYYPSHVAQPYPLLRVSFHLLSGKDTKELQL